MEGRNPEEKISNDEQTTKNEENKTKSPKIKKERKKPNIIIPIFQINMTYNQMIYQKKIKIKKKKKIMIH